MDSLRFGPICEDEDRAERRIDCGGRNHARGEWRGGGDAGYGNCFGVPNLGGETQFEACYSGNPLVNAFALGLVKKDEIFYAKATGVGNPVIYVGAKTGRDGIHGATMASEEFTRARSRSGRMCRWATRLWRSCCWRLPGGDGDRGGAGDSGHGRGGVDVLDLRDGRARRAGADD